VIVFTSLKIKRLKTFFNGIFGIVGLLGLGVSCFNYWVDKIFSECIYIDLLFKVIIG